MNFLGYKGTESIGLNEMNRVAFELNGGFMTKLAQLALIYYWVYGKPHGENIPDDLSLCKQLINAELEIFPQVNTIVDKKLIIVRIWTLRYGISLVGFYINNYH